MILRYAESVRRTSGQVNDAMDQGMDQSGDGKITLGEFEMMFENEGNNVADVLLPQFFLSRTAIYLLSMYL